MDFGTDPAEDVVGVDIGCPHCLVVTGEQGEVGAPQFCPHMRGGGKDPHPLGDLLQGSDADLAHRAVKAAEGPACFLIADQSPRREEVDKLILVIRVGDGERIAHDRCKHQWHGRQLAQEADPCKVLCPREEHCHHAVHLLVVEFRRRSLRALAAVDRCGADDIGKIAEAGEVGLCLPCLAFLVIPVLRSVPKRTEPLGADHQQSDFCPFDTHIPIPPICLFGTVIIHQYVRKS